MVSGLRAALVAPAGSIDHASLTAHARHLVARGCDGLVLFGASGKGSSPIMQRLAAAGTLSLSNSAEHGLVESLNDAPDHALPRRACEA